MRDHRFTWRQMLRIVLALGWSDFRLKYRGSALGYAWSFLLPLLKFVVILHVLRPMLGGSIPYYPFYLLLGLLLWEHFALTTMACVETPLHKSALIQKFSMPRILLPLAVGWQHLLIVSSHIVVFVLICMLLQVPFSPGSFYVVVVLLQLTLVSMGIGMALGAYVLRYRDVGHLWNVLLQVLFWLTPVIYAYDLPSPLSEHAAVLLRAGMSFSLPSLLDVFIRFQPVSVLIFDARRSLVPAVGSIPSPIHMIGVSVLSLLIFMVGALLFRRRSKYFVQEY